LVGKLNSKYNIFSVYVNIEYEFELIKLYDMIYLKKLIIFYIITKYILKLIAINSKSLLTLFINNYIIITL